MVLPYWYSIDACSEIFGWETFLRASLPRSAASVSFLCFNITGCSHALVSVVLLCTGGGRETLCTLRLSINLKIFPFPLQESDEWYQISFIGIAYSLFL